MKVGVIGSRTITDYNLIKNKLDILNEHYKITKIVSGGAKGVDSYGKKYANDNGLPITEYLPDWNKYNKAAGFIRNQDIVKDSNIVIAFIENGSKGTMDSINQCHKYFINIVVINIDGSVDRDLSKIYRPLNYVYKHARRVKVGEPYYEVSSKGNKAYSAIYAKINDVSIEEIYQLDIKGYRGIYKDWKLAKGKPPKVNITEEETYRQYKNLWYEYFKNNITLYIDILSNGVDTTITDMFGITPINQARAICDLCNKGLYKE